MSERSAQIHAFEERLVRCIEEKRYDDVRVIGEELLPLIVDEDRSVRLRVYHLLQRCPGVELPETHRWNARVVAEDVMADRTGTPEERIRAQMLHMLLGVFPVGGSPPEGSDVVPSRRWLSQELRELYADEATTEVLGRGFTGDRELRRDAHIVRCCTCPDRQSVAAHLEVLLADGEETAIVQGCCGASEEFHQETGCQFLDRALTIVTGERAVARLLEYKLSVLLALYMRSGGREDTKENEERYEALYGDFVATMARLELCGGAPLERAHGHLYLAILAEWHGEDALAEIHCDMAKALAEQLQNSSFQEVVTHCREWLLSEEKDGVMRGEEEEEEQEEQEKDGEDQYDEDKDDDDEADAWKRV